MLKTTEPKTPLLPLLLPWSEFLSDRWLGGVASVDFLLKLEVLRNGLWDYWMLAADPRVSGAFHEEESWVLSEERDWPYSFRNLCDTFFLEPESMRRALEAWRKFHHQLSEVAR